MAMLEADMEDLLIQQLSYEANQWTYRPDLRTEEDLWNNLREKLNKNNIDKLQGVLLTDSEMDQVKEFLRDTGASTYKAARWLSGEHQVAQIPLRREDASLGEISLMAINNREIAGGRSSYELINQFQSKGSLSGARDRRFDVTLLINGLPLIHIELKNQDHPFMDAFRQISKYCKEGKFRGLMGLVQMFVVSNGTNTRYIAADNHGNMNEQFLIRWVNEKNEPVEDYLAFAKAALNIPFAHHMIGNYSVLDNASKRAIILRPYQIHAIEAIRKASREGRDGFIWHTTGSGKTLTSYTVTKNLLDIPSLDKAVFLIDRKDLDQQTFSSFEAYADSDDIDILNTPHTKSFEAQLKNKDRCAIVATIQKMQQIIRWYSNDDLSAKDQKVKDLLSNKNIAFIVDECHRAVTPESKRELQRFFKKTWWYGFTGTPIFEENKREQKGNLARTTAGVYGDPKDPDKSCLHTYTIKEAIGDKAVLGFKIQGMGSQRSTLEELALQLKLMNEQELEDTTDVELEKAVVRAFPKATGHDFYDDDRHRNLVIDYIINKSSAKLRLNANEGEAFEGMLTVSSIQDAQHYYKLIKQFVADGKVKEEIRKLLPDFPKVAITYTVGENEDGASANQDEMKKSLEDYNDMFGTSWDLSTLGAYNTDLNARLARKGSKYSSRKEQLDLVIVVDRLLTGFDAPCLSTIFLDRPPMKPQHLVQAFSRTNRIFINEKRYGHIVTFQTPELYAERIDEALRLYTNGGLNDVQAPTWAETSEKLKSAVDSLRTVSPNLKKLDELLAHGALEELQEFAKAFQKVDRLLSEAQVYDEFKEDMLEDEFDLSREEFESMSGKYENIIERIKELRDKEDDDDSVIDIDVEYELESIKRIEVNYRYLVNLIQAHIPEGTDQIRSATPDEDKRICNLIKGYSKANPKLGGVLQQLWLELQFNPEQFRDMDAINIIEARMDTMIDQEIRDFSSKWGVNVDALKAYITSAKASEIDPIAVRSMSDFTIYKEAGGSLNNKLKYSSELRKSIAAFIKDTIKPMLHR